MNLVRGVYMCCVLILYVIGHMSYVIGPLRSQFSKSAYLKSTKEYSSKWRKCD